MWALFMKMYAKMKELGPVGGGRVLGMPPLDQPMILVVSCLRKQWSAQTDTVLR